MGISRMTNLDEYEYIEYEKLHMLIGSIIAAVFTMSIAGLLATHVWFALISSSSIEAGDLK